MRMIRRHYLFLDLGFYSACNLKCTYCRDEIVKDKKDFHLRNLKDQIEHFGRVFEAGVVKLSGYGEITMWKDFAASLAYLAPRFPQVQVITNGTFERKTADLILRYPNVSPNITIDGQTMEANSIRLQGNRQWHERILRNIRYFTEEGRSIELNCVLHERNVKHLKEFCEYLMGVSEERIMLFPFPVKSFDRAREASEGMKNGFEALAAELETIYDEYGRILPPKAYLCDLKRFLERGFRSNPCHIHWANLGSGSRNERLHCANYGEDLSYGPMDTALSVDIDRIGHLANENLQVGQVGPRCKKCFNHYHVINLFLEDRISLSELQTLPSLQAPGIVPIALAMKDEFRSSYRGPEILRR